TAAPTPARRPRGRARRRRSVRRDLRQALFPAMPAAEWQGDDPRLGGRRLRTLLRQIEQHAGIDALQILGRVQIEAELRIDYQLDAGVCGTRRADVRLEAARPERG